MFNVRPSYYENLKPPHFLSILKRAILKGFLDAFKISLLKVAPYKKEVIGKIYIVRLGGS
jgi:hypothetical protein